MVQSRASRAGSFGYCGRWRRCAYAIPPPIRCANDRLKSHEISINRIFSGITDEFGAAVDFTSQPLTIAHTGSSSPEASTFVKLDASSVSVGPVLFSASSTDNIGSKAIGYSAGLCRLPGIPWFGERFADIASNTAGQFCTKINCTAMAQSEVPFHLPAPLSLNIFFREPSCGLANVCGCLPGPNLVDISMG